LSSLISAWKANPEIGGNVIAWRTIPSQQADERPFPQNLHASLKAGLRVRGISSFYSHQAQAWDLIEDQRNIALVTSTASGKTLAYNMPVLNDIFNNPENRAIYLFPTKALARDQYEEITKWENTLSEAEKIMVGVYDGDTPKQARPQIRKNAQILITNPDMLHMGILPHHPKWVDFFKNLRWVIIDEMHTYRGVFGSHVANVIRRIKRIAKFYGASPQFILTSATIANPVQLASSLINDEVTLVNNDGAPRGTRHFMIYNPPVVDEALGIRKSVLKESVFLANELLINDIQTILFGRARRTIEVMLNYLRQRSGLSSTQIRGYRSGYRATQRREIEAGLRSGEVKAVVSTNALELGIDIGGMDAAVLAGYPGTIAGTWQQAGRAGRSTKPSLAALVTSANPLDQFLAKHPDYFFYGSPEKALINPKNMLILLSHLRCAAFELPFQVGDEIGKVEWEELSQYLEVMVASDEIYFSNDKYYWMADNYPAASVSLRSASPNQVVLHAPKDDGWFIVGEVDGGSADWMVHPEAIYIHDGRTYIVESLDFEQNVAFLKPSFVDYYTEPIHDSKVDLSEKFEHGKIVAGEKAYGELSITNKITGYNKIEWFSHIRVGSGEVDLPQRTFLTNGFWFSLDESFVDKLIALGIWNSQVNDYGENWKSMAASIRSRDEHTCQHCGSKEEGRTLHVHHKKPLRSFRSLADANREDNLVSLCSRCHKKAEDVVKVRTGLGGLAFVLGNLAPLFLMCDKGDLGIHVDPQSPIAEGQPVVILYDQTPAGVGISERLFELYEDLVKQAYSLVDTCECTDGCPSCVGPGGEQGEGAKKETLAILKLMK
jgi:DEAD/DEAH box helicase domain-containing protein